MAIEFKLLADIGDAEFKIYTIASQAYAIGDLVMLSATAGTVVPATSASTPSKLIGVAMEAKTSADTSLLVALVNSRQIWQADVTNTANTAHNMQRMVLTDKGTVNNTGTDSTASTAVFRQEGVSGTTRIVGRFLGMPSA